ncbi:hypothetical protein EVAR_2229_1 [Eumeta japonica]|uniref:Uncharacterized protein n=1 Tax=Eumeta variegata TaxID=151549 RepID=A0A4C1SFK6_EUMVA|nr:hypothetical protein EVAR_2229_1 [Eumeta japonica]
MVRKDIRIPKTYVRITRSFVQPSDIQASQMSIQTEWEDLDRSRTNSASGCMRIIRMYAESRVGTKIDFDNARERRRRRGDSAAHGALPQLQSRALTARTQTGLFEKHILTAASLVST